MLSPFPVTEKLLCYFASALANDGLAPQTIKGYLAAVRSMQISLGLPPPRDQSSLPLLKRVIDGIRRQRVIGGKPTRTRLPITVTVLRRMQGTLSTANNLDGTAFWAIATSAFFGFFRLGELLIETETSYHQHLHLSWGDVAIDDRTATTMVKFHLRKSKCDQFGTGADVLVGRTGCQLCPIAAMLAYLKVRGDHPGAFFVDSNRAPITKSKFVTKVREALKAAGYPEEQFAGHSFRIGAATTAAMAGIEDSTIQTLGRWHSAAFLRYIRTPHDQLASMSASLAKQAELNGRDHL